MGNYIECLVWLDSGQLTSIGYGKMRWDGSMHTGVVVEYCMWLQSYEFCT